MVRVLLICISIVTINLNTFAQNLVMNPSFESVNMGNVLCSWYVSASEFNSAINNWTMPTGGSTDIFHSSLATSCFCSPWSTHGSAVGQQAPRTGNAMSAIFVYGAGGCTPYREYLQGRLSSPLVVGQQYTIEFYVSLADYSQYACNNIGVYFTTSSFYNSSMCVYSVTPHVNYTGIITDKTGWTLISMNFTATAAFQYFTIGNFYYDNQTTTTNVGGSKTQTRYFVDDVSIMISNVNPVITVNNASICPGQSATLTASSSIAGTTYVWSNGATGSSITVSPGSTTTYTVTGTSPAGGTGTATATVTVNPVPTPSASSNSPICEGETLNLNSSGGTGYSWSGPASWTANTQNPSRSNATVSMAGNYAVTVSNSFGCTATASTNVVIQTRPDASVAVAGPFCITDAPVNLNAATPGGTWSGPGVNASTGLFSPALAGAGNHNISYTVSNGVCTSSSSLVVHVDAGVNASITPAGPFCVNSSPVNLSAVSGGGVWSGTGITNATNGTFSPNAAGQGSHIITYSIANGQCSDSDTEPIVVNPLPVVSISGLLAGYCDDASPVSIGVSPVGGVLSGPGVSGYTFNPAVAGIGVHTMEYSYTDGNMCSNSTSQQVEVFAIPVVQISGLSNQYCFGADAVTVTGTPAGGVFSGPGISANQFDPSVAGLGTHSIQYAYNDGNGCAATTTVQTIVTGNPVASVHSFANPTCYGYNNGNLTLAVSGGTSPYSYIWSNPPGASGPSTTGMGAGNYSITVSDAYGCSSTVAANLTEPQEVTILLTVNQHVSCYGYNNGMATAIASGGNGGFSYVWSDSPPTQQAVNSHLAAGNWQVTAIDIAGCQAVASIEIVQPEVLSLVVNSEPLICGQSQGSVSTTVSGGTPPYQYLWSNGSPMPSVQPIAPGSYSITLTDANSCSIIDTVLVGMSGVSTVTLSQLSPILCHGDANAVISGSMDGGMSPFSYQWSTGATQSTLVNMPAGTYGLTVNDAWGCSGTQSITVTQPEPLILSLIGQHVSCYGYSDGRIQAQVEGGTGNYSYSWSSGATTANLQNLQAGSYFVVVSDANSCQVTGSQLINQPAMPLHTVISANDVSCYGSRDGSVNLNITGGTSPYTYRWFVNGFESSLQHISGLYGGIYYLTVTDANNCESDTTVVIGEPLAIQVDYESQGPSCIGYNDGYIELIVSGGTEPYVYQWSRGETIIEYFAGLIEGDYSFTITDVRGCELSLPVISLVDNPVDCIRIPNAFTPNGDGVNDSFIVENLSMFPGAVTQIYNRWGQMLYEAKGADVPWDGTYNGKLVPTGSYLYVVNLFNGELPYVGVVTLLK